MTDIKKSAPAKTTITRDTIDIERKVNGNLFESLVIISKRANQIQKDVKEEIKEKLNEFAQHSDNLEEVFENREQIEMSRHYERMAKPHSIALHDLMENKIYWRKTEKPVAKEE
jgi:BioD-like phosphotransacetylase family protein